MGSNQKKFRYAWLLGTMLLANVVISMLALAGGCGGAPATSSPPPATSSAPAKTTAAAATTAAVPTTSAAAPTTAATTKPTTAATTAAAPTTSAATTAAATTKPATTAAATTAKTTAATGAAAANKPDHLVIDIEKMETSGFSTVWLRPMNPQGSIQVVEGTVSAKLTLINKDGSRTVAFTWDKITLDETNYTLMAKGAEVSFPYPNKQEHDYNEPGILQVILTLKDGTKLTAELSNISLHPSVVS